MEPRRTVWLEDDGVHLIDQRRLPLELEILVCPTAEAVARAIEGLAVRGAPAIGVTAACGLAVGARELPAADPETFWAGLEQVAARLRRTRPTAVNLFWAIERAMARARQALEGGGPEAARAALAAEARAMADEDVAANRAIGRHGAELVPDGARVLTICNTGALATVDYGTALGVVRAAHEAGKAVSVWVAETRPVLQGARLTTWELARLGIPHTLVVDGAAGHLMRTGRVDLVLSGADRIAGTGDVANKIGTYSLAVLARAHGLPFYVAAPVSTVDLGIPDGEAIEIEERDPAEVTHLAGRALAAPGTPAANPAFDVTPHELVTAIITDRGVVRPPYGPGLRRAVETAGGPPRRSA